MLIAIIGPDGAGKTTLAHQMVQYFSTSSHSFASIKMYELRPHRFPTLTQLTKRLIFLNSVKNQQSKAKSSGLYYSGMVKPKGLIIGSINIFWYSLEYVFERLLCCFRPESLDIYARYSCDYIFVRAYRGIPLWIKKIPYALSRKPDYLFYVRRNAQDIYKEKPELSVDEIVLQDSIIIDQFNSTKNFFTLPPDSSDSSTLAVAVKIIELSWANQ